MRPNGTRKGNFPVAISILAVLIGPLGLPGCSHTPAVYKMEPREVGGIRSDINTVGVVLAPYPAQVEAVLPARGWWGGAKRGFVAGATAPVVISLFVPVPGGRVIGLLVAPFTAVAGSVYGAFKALPAETVEGTEAVLKEAAVRMRGMNLQEEFLETVLKTGNERTGWKFVPLPDKGPKERKEVVHYDPQDIPGIDSILEIRKEKAGLRGFLRMNPPSSAFLELRSRLIRVSDNRILLEETLSCESEERLFERWGEDGGRLFIDAFRSCIGPLAEKVVEDFFLVRPIPAR